MQTQLSLPIVPVTRRVYRLRGINAVQLLCKRHFQSIADGYENKHTIIYSINCAALSDSLLLSELFGHERGAFTCAIERKLGKFEIASCGILFLDEIGDMPLETQAKMLKVIEEHGF